MNSPIHYTTNVVLLLTFSGLRILFMLSILINANFDLESALAGCILNRFNNIKMINMNSLFFVFKIFNYNWHITL